MSQHGFAAVWPVESSKLFAAQLLVRPPMYEEENYLGYRLRLAYVNGIADPAWLQPVQGIENFPRGVGRARWCPKCLNESEPFWPASWGEGPAACMKHQCWLIDVCPACRRVTTWRHVRLISCRCGHPLPNTASVLFSESVAHLLVAPVLADDAEIPCLPLSVRRRWQFAQFLGALRIYGLTRKPLKKSSSMSPEIENAVITAGADVLLGGNKAFQQLLDHIRVKPALGTPVQLIGDAFPALLTRVRKCLNQAEREFVLVNIRQYVMNSVDSEFPVTWREKMRPTLQGAKNCALQLKIRPERVLPVLSQHSISPVVRHTATGRKMVTVGRQQLEQAQISLKNSLSPKNASRRYGLSPARQSELAKAGLIRMLASKIDASSIDNLLQRITTCVQHDLKKTFTDTIVLTEALRTLVPEPVTTLFVRAILDKQVHAFSSNEKVRSFKDVNVSRQQVAEFIKGVKTSSDEYFSIPEAAQHLGLKQEVLYYLVNAGLIAISVRRVGRRPARFITKMELERFTGQIEPLSHVAARRGISSRECLRQIRGERLKIVSGPGIDGGRQYFVRRNNLKKF